MKSSPPNRSDVKTVEIGSAHAGQRIDNYLMGQLKGVPRSRIYKLLRDGQVRVNSGRKKPLYKLKSGDMVRIPPVSTASRETPAIPDSVKKLLSEAVLFENENILVLNKPSGLAVHSGSGLSFGVIEALKTKQPDQFLELAHRELDVGAAACPDFGAADGEGRSFRHDVSFLAGLWCGVRYVQAVRRRKPHRRAGV